MNSKSRTEQLLTGLNGFDESLESPQLIALSMPRVLSTFSYFQHFHISSSSSFIPRRMTTLQNSLDVKHLRNCTLGTAELGALALRSSAGFPTSSSSTWVVPK